MKQIIQERQKISQVWRAGRLLAGKTQIDLARALEISQSNVSKIESMLLEPSAVDWYKFCQLVGIDAHRSWELGFIDGCTKFKSKLHMTSLFKMPMKYRGDFALKVRDLIPFKECVINELNEKAWEDYLKEVKIEPEVFWIYDFQISFNFLLDLQVWSQKRNLKIFDKVRKYSANLENHGVLKENYSRKKTSTALLQDLLANQAYYQRVFKIETSESASGLKVKLNIEPEVLDVFGEKELNPYLLQKIQSFQEMIKKNSDFTGKFDLADNGCEFYVKLSA